MNFLFLRLTLSFSLLAAAATEKYRRSYPSASSSFASSSYREESTDTDSSVVRSPQPPPHRQRRLPSQQTLPSRPEPPPGEPHYQFRKSNSMKLALKEGLQGDPPRVAVFYCSLWLPDASALSLPSLDPTWLRLRTNHADCDLCSSTHHDMSQFNSNPPVSTCA